MVILCAVVDAFPDDAEHRPRGGQFHLKARLRGYFGSIYVVGQPAISATASSPKTFRFIYALPAGLDAGKPTCALQSAAGPNARLHFAGGRECFRWRLLLPGAKKNALCGSRHAGPGFLLVGWLFGQLSDFSKV